MNWQLAESAPKTGEHILVSNVGRGDFGTCGGVQQDYTAIVHWWDNPGEEGFYLSNGYPHDASEETPITFTHWAPLTGKNLGESLLARAALGAVAPQENALSREARIAAKLLLEIGERFPATKEDQTRVRCEIVAGEIERILAGAVAPRTEQQDVANIPVRSTMLRSGRGMLSELLDETALEDLRAALSASPAVATPANTMTREIAELLEQAAAQIERDAPEGDVLEGRAALARKLRGAISSVAQPTEQEPPPMKENDHHEAYKQLGWWMPDDAAMREAILPYEHLDADAVEELPNPLRSLIFAWRNVQTQRGASLRSDDPLGKFSKISQYECDTILFHIATALYTLRASPVSPEK